VRNTADININQKSDYGVDERLNENVLFEQVHQRKINELLKDTELFARYRSIQEID